MEELNAKQLIKIVRWSFRKGLAVGTLGGLALGISAVFVGGAFFARLEMKDGVWTYIPMTKKD